MNYNNYLTKEEKSVLDINNNINKISQEELRKFDSNIIIEVEFEVLTDGTILWVSAQNFRKICNGFDASQLQVFDFKIDTEVVSESTYVQVTNQFLNFIKENTINPKYVPRLSPLKVKERSINTFDHINDMERKSFVNTIDNRTEIEYEQERGISR